MSNTCRTAAVFLFAGVCGMRAPAQISMGTLSGTVKDATSAVIQGATVEVKNLGTNFVRATKTDGNGQLVVPDLAVAHH